MATCYRHPSRETGVACSNCGRPICPDCMTTTAVGMRCPECAGQTTKVRTLRSSKNRGYEATLALIAINVIVFFVEGSSALTLAGEADPSSTVMYHGLLFGPFIEVQHEYWRLLTSGFLHWDVIHIALNMYVLYWLGRLLEPAIGRTRFLSIYFTGLLAGSLGVLIVSPTRATAGASGAIFGLMGAAFAEAQRRGAEQVRNQLVLMIAINLALTLGISGISIGAHIGGLIGGGVATVAFQQADHRRLPALGYAACLALAALTVAASIVVANNIAIGPS
jgi:membrane associated rhomboid family serine protease